MLAPINFFIYLKNFPLVAHCHRTGNVYICVYAVWIYMKIYIIVIASYELYDPCDFFPLSTYCIYFSIWYCFFLYVYYATAEKTIMGNVKNNKTIIFVIIPSQVCTLCKTVCFLLAPSLDCSIQIRIRYPEYLRLHTFIYYTCCNEYMHIKRDTRT